MWQRHRITVEERRTKHYRADLTAINSSLQKRGKHENDWRKKCASGYV
jgi:hypothetical protein